MLRRLVAYERERVALLEGAWDLAYSLYTCPCPNTVDTGVMISHWCRCGAPCGFAELELHDDWMREMVPDIDALSEEDD